jgi:methyl-accepting chemotaxis protein
MKMKPKIMLGSTAIAIIAVLITTIGITLIVNNLVTISLQNEIKSRLILQRDMQKDRLENYLSRINEEVQESAALNPTFSKALIDFTQAFSKFTRQLQSNDDEKETSKNISKESNNDFYKQNLEKYYAQQFTEEFLKKNVGKKPIAIKELLAKTDQHTLALQYHYIANNPHPINTKDALLTLDNITTNYSYTHKKYHPLLKAYKEKWAFQNIFLVDAKTGYVVYSTEKELAYATSLRTGYYEKSGLGNAFKQALADNKQGKTYTTKMQPYYPSYNDFASFVSTPLYVNSVLKGVFIIQMPLDNINNIMTFNQQWEKYGLGKSGETYLVADDTSMRSNTRALSDDPKAYFAALKKSGVDQNTISTIAKKQSSIGLQHVKSIVSQSALKGKTGFDHCVNYRDIPVLSAYAPLNIQGVKWAILAETNTEEAFQVVTDIKQKIIKAAFLIGTILIFFSALTSFLFANKLVAPITKFRNIIQRFHAGEDTLRLNTTSNDELGQLAKTVDQLLDERVQTLYSITQENDALNESIIEMLYVSSAQSNGDLTAKMIVKDDVTGTLADSLNLVMQQTGKTLNHVKATAHEVDTAAKTVQQQSATVLESAAKERVIMTKTTQELNVSSAALQQIAELAQQCNLSANENIIATDSAQKSVLASVEDMSAIKEEMSETEKRIKRLSERSQAIAGVTTIIQGIAERTHVLALNATMHATAAGDAGRGFASVATEIQRLAENASEATQKIDTLVKNIQMDTIDTIKTMNTAITQVAEGNKTAEYASSQMLKTHEKSYELAERVQAIAAHSIKQAEVSTELQQQAIQVQQSNNETTKQLEQQQIQTHKLVTFAQNLLQSISKFKT